MALKLMCYDLTIQYREGESNGNVDGLSRQAWLIDTEEDEHGERKEPDDGRDEGTQTEDKSSEDFTDEAVNDWTGSRDSECYHPGPPSTRKPHTSL